MRNLLKQKNNIIILFVLLTIVFIASLPAFRDGIYNGFDLWFHIGRIESIAEELKNGQFPVRYEHESWYGNGYISTTMYGNILLYLPAILHMCGMATYKCYNIYVIFINILGVAISMYSFSRIFKDKRYGLLATISYMLAGYYISNIYIRAAVGEYTATIFLPLVVYGIYRVLYETDSSNIISKILPLVIGATGVIQSHVLTTYMLAMTILVYLLVFIKDSLEHIKELLIASVLIIGINVFFLLPFLDCYSSYVFRASQTTVGTNIQKYGLYLDQIFGLFPEGRGGRAEWSSSGEESNRIGIIIVCLFIIFAIYKITKRFIKRKVDKEAERRVNVLFFIGLLTAWMSSAYFPWGIFSGDNAVSNIMRSVQYPSRYMLIQTLLYIICGVYAFEHLIDSTVKKKSLAIVAIGIIMILALVQNGIFMYTLSCRSLTVQAIDGHESIADDLYLFSGIDMENIEREARVLEGTDCLVEDRGYSGDIRQIFIDNKSDSEVTVLVPIFCYKYITAETADGTQYKLEPSGSYQYEITVAPGFSDTLLVRFKEPITWRVAEIISLICIITIIVLSIRDKRNSYHE